VNIAGYEVDLECFHQHAGRALPRHVAYPMPTWWEELSAADADALLRASRQREPANALSLYVHVPFCEKLCRYCACTRAPLPRSAPGADAKTDAYVASVEREAAQLVERLGRGQVVRQIHWGGGTPTYLSCDRLQRIHATLGELFAIAPDAELAIELDPRVTTDEMLRLLRRLGFTRVSLGIQDFDPGVQAHVGRIQPFDMVAYMVKRCRDLGFVSINFDLIYGLPRQTLETIERTLEQTIRLSPDRIAYYQFAQIPDKIAVQRGLDYGALPDSEEKLRMFLLGLRTLTDAGYEFIGLDHFAKPDEPLARASRRDAAAQLPGNDDRRRAGPGRAGRVVDQPPRARRFPAERARAARVHVASRAGRVADLSAASGSAQTTSSGRMCSRSCTAAARSGRT
jgi:oxygen-independent coproporphyrinogen-3 oxidase